MNKHAKRPLLCWAKPAFLHAKKITCTHKTLAHIAVGGVGRVLAAAEVRLARLLGDKGLGAETRAFVLCGQRAVRACNDCFHV